MPDRSGRFARLRCARDGWRPPAADRVRAGIAPGGLAGHLLLLLVAWLMHLGRSTSVAPQGSAPGWPAELVLIAIVLGPLALASTAVALGQVAQHGPEPQLWLVYVVAATVHAMASAALLAIAAYVVLGSRIRSALR